MIPGIQVHTWAGYVVQGPSSGSVTNVVGSWVVPAVNCSATKNSSVLEWVGIDGWNTLHETVEQIGTRSNCIQGVANYEGWYEFWPRQNITVDLLNMTIRPGDMVTASVSGETSTKEFSMSIADGYGDQATHIHGNYSQAMLTTAEWIVEAPGPLVGEKQSLADFGSIQFENAYAVIDGQRQPLVAWAADSTMRVTALTYACADGTVKAQPSPLVRTNDTFSVAWSGGGSC